MAALDQVFERAAWVLEAVVGKRPFATVTALHQAMLEAFEAAPYRRRFDLLAGGIDHLAAGLAARKTAMSGRIAPRTGARRPRHAQRRRG